MSAESSGGVQSSLVLLGFVGPTRFASESDTRRAVGVSGLRTICTGISRRSRCLHGRRVQKYVAERVRMTVGKVDQSPDGAELSRRVAEYVRNAAKDAIDARGAFTVAISGGSLPKMLAKELVQEPFISDPMWKHWNVFFADERCVPLDHEDSNYKLAKEVFFDRVAIPADQIFAIDASLSPDQCANEYYQRMVKATTCGSDFVREDGAMPVFDLILLGMGPDGHTASLFPGHKLLSEADRWVAEILDSPKPPPSRITLTLAVLNGARRVAFLAAGAGKQDMLELIHEKPPSGLPSQMVNPVSGNLVWFIDEAAGAKLSNQ